MLGPYSTTMTKAVAPVTEKYGVPMVEAEGASRSLFTQGYKYMFAVLSTSEYYLAPVLDLIAQRSKNDGKSPSDLRIGMAFENDGFSLDVRAGVLDVAKKYNMKIVIDDKLPADLSDMSATLTKFKALKPDILLVSGHSKGAATAARQIEEMKIKAPAIAITHCEAAKVHVKFPKSANGLLCPTQWLTNLPNSEPLFGDAQKYDREFKVAYPEYNTGIPYQTAQASAAVLVFKDAFERANSFDQDKVRDALSATDMDTFYGPVKFSEAGNNIAKPMFYRQIQADGSYKNIVSSKDMTMPRKVAY
jgi:branched-chain amino acid transport system substrate-binding protein